MINSNVNIGDDVIIIKGSFSIFGKLVSIDKSPNVTGTHLIELPNDTDAPKLPYPFRVYCENGSVFQKNWNNVLNQCNFTCDNNKKYTWVEPEYLSKHNKKFKAKDLNYGDQILFEGKKATKVKSKAHSSSNIFRLEDQISSTIMNGPSFFVYKSTHHDPGNWVIEIKDDQEVEVLSRAKSETSTESEIKYEDSVEEKNTGQTVEIKSLHIGDKILYKNCEAKIIHKLGKTASISFGSTTNIENCYCSHNLDPENWMIDIDESTTVKLLEHYNCKEELNIGDQVILEEKEEKGKEYTCVVAAKSNGNYLLQFSNSNFKHFSLSYFGGVNNLSELGLPEGLSKSSYYCWFSNNSKYVKSIIKKNNDKTNTVIKNDYSKILNEAIFGEKFLLHFPNGTYSEICVIGKDDSNRSIIDFGPKMPSEHFSFCHADCYSQNTQEKFNLRKDHFYNSIDDTNIKNLTISKIDETPVTFSSELKVNQKIYIHGLEAKIIDKNSSNALYKLDFGTIKPQHLIDNGFFKIDDFDYSDRKNNRWTAWSDSYTPPKKHFLSNLEVNDIVYFPGIPGFAQVYQKDLKGYLLDLSNIQDLNKLKLQFKNGAIFGTSPKVWSDKWIEQKIVPNNINSIIEYKIENKLCITDFTVKNNLVIKGSLVTTINGNSLFKFAMDDRSAELMVESGLFKNKSFFKIHNDYYAWSSDCLKQSYKDLSNEDKLKIIQDSKVGDELVINGQTTSVISVNGDKRLISLADGKNKINDFFAAPGDSFSDWKEKKLDPSINYSWDITNELSKINSISLNKKTIPKVEKINCSVLSNLNIGTKISFNGQITEVINKLSHFNPLYKKNDQVLLDFGTEVSPNIAKYFYGIPVIGHLFQQSYVGEPIKHDHYYLWSGTFIDNHDMVEPYLVKQEENNSMKNENLKILPLGSEVKIGDYTGTIHEHSSKVHNDTLIDFGNTKPNFPHGVYKGNQYSLPQERNLIDNNYYVYSEKINFTNYPLEVIKIRTEQDDKNFIESLAVGTKINICGINATIHETSKDAKFTIIDLGPTKPNFIVDNAYLGTNENWVNAKTRSFKESNYYIRFPHLS